MVARHRSKNVTLHSQGDINFVINAEPDSFGQQFRAGARALGVRHGVPREGRRRRVRARRVDSAPSRIAAASGPMELNIPAIVGIGGSLIYFVDRYGERSIYDVDFKPVTPAAAGARRARCYIDHLTHNVHRGHMDKWTGFYEKLFNFREIRYFDIEGKKTGLFSRALTSPCGKIRIPINESQDDKSQIEEYLREYQRRGHPAHRAGHRRHLSHRRRAARPWRRVPGHAGDLLRGRRRARRRAIGENIEELRERRILIDGSGASDEGVLLQIFTANVIGPIFFEIIQRKGNQGFGEGNFKALFESIELDQIRRGVI